MHARSTATASCCCGPTCTSPGVATRCFYWMRRSLLRWPRGTDRSRMEARTAAIRGKPSRTPLRSMRATATAPILHRHHRRHVDLDKHAGPRELADRQQRVRGQRIAAELLDAALAVVRLVAHVGHAWVTILTTCPSVAAVLGEDALDLVPGVLALRHEVLPMCRISPPLPFSSSAPTAAARKIAFEPGPGRVTAFREAALGPFAVAVVGLTSSSCADAASGSAASAMAAAKVLHRSMSPSLWSITWSFVHVPPTIDPLVAKPPAWSSTCAPLAAAVLGRRIFDLVVADAVAARHEDHGGRRDARHVARTSCPAPETISRRRNSAARAPSLARSCAQSASNLTGAWSRIFAISTSRPSSSVTP